MSNSQRIDRVVLLGFMSSGKSTIGAALARRLGWNFIDFDVEIEERDGRPVALLVEEEGEEHLRRLEALLTEEVAQREAAVLAPGGGWITNPELLETIRPDSLLVWLRVSASEVVRRIRADSHHRPFQDHPEPLVPISAMMDEREPLYRLADMAVPVDGRTVEEVAFELEQIVRYRRS